jgi:hypothetical protein
MATATAEPDMTGEEMIAKTKEIMAILNAIEPSSALAILSMVDADQVTRPDLRPDVTLDARLSLHIRHILENAGWVERCRNAGRWPNELDELDRSRHNG